MLTDPTQSEEFRTSSHWQSPHLNFQLRVQQDSGDGPAFRSNSLSGNERNRLLISGEEGFEDRSLVSGVDFKEDSRSFVTLDIDNDGWLDLVVTSPNTPRLRIFRNNLGKLGHHGRLVHLKLTGTESNRDAVGALIQIKTNRGQRAFQRSLGEGLSSQNPDRIAITLAEGEILLEMTIRWPSGMTSNRSFEETPDVIEMTEPDS